MEYPEIISNIKLNHLHSNASKTREMMLIPDGRSTDCTSGHPGFECIAAGEIQIFGCSPWQKMGLHAQHRCPVQGGSTSCLPAEESDVRRCSVLLGELREGPDETQQTNQEGWLCPGLYFGLHWGDGREGWCSQNDITHGQPLSPPTWLLAIGAPLVTGWCTIGAKQDDTEAHSFQWMLDSVRPWNGFSTITPCWFALLDHFYLHHLMPYCPHIRAIILLYVYSVVIGWMDLISEMFFCVPDSVSIDEEVRITTHLWQSWGIEGMYWLFSKIYKNKIFSDIVAAWQVCKKNNGLHSPICSYESS